MLLAHVASPPACHTPDEIPAHTVWTWLALICINMSNMYYMYFRLKFPDILSQVSGTKTIATCAVWGQELQYSHEKIVALISSCQQHIFVFSGDCWSWNFLNRKYFNINTSELTSIDQNFTWSELCFSVMIPSTFILSENAALKTNSHLGYFSPVMTIKKVVGSPLVRVGF